MKFLGNTKLIYYPLDNLYKENLSYIYESYSFKKYKIKDRKKFKLTRPGILVNLKKSSIYRDDGNTLLQQFINLNTKKGKKILAYKNINKLAENLIFSLTYYSNEFDFYKNYLNIFNFYNSDLDFPVFNNIFNSITLDLESIFEIKTKKNNKKLKLKDKYSHEIVYIPKERRKKYVVRALSFYKESFKNYSLWERLFWSFFNVLMNKHKSFLKKRREYIYIKSLKFFNKKKNPLK